MEHPPPLRVARDGLAYTWQQFLQHYGSCATERWNEAAPLHTTGVDGLQLAQVKDSTHVGDALLELETAFARHGESFEFGFGIQWNEDPPCVGIAAGGSIDEYPMTMKLIAEAEKALDSTSYDSTGYGGLEAIQITCRRYREGSELQFHKDRVEYYTEVVFGFVLRNTSNKTLEFLKGEQYFAIDEHPGTCWRMSDAARYHWRHGVSKLERGERISVTWRWFQQEHL